MLWFPTVPEVIFLRLFLLRYEGLDCCFCCLFCFLLRQRIPFVLSHFGTGAASLVGGFNSQAPPIPAASYSWLEAFAAPVLNQRTASGSGET